MKYDNIYAHLENIFLDDVPSKLRMARNIVKDVPNQLFDFADYLASVAENRLNPSQMVLLFLCGLTDLETETCGFEKIVPFPQTLKEEKYHIIAYISYFPLIIDEIATQEFSEGFRELFWDLIDEPQPPRY